LSLPKPHGRSPLYAAANVPAGATIDRVTLKYR
jgi:hypothetical protein